MQELSQRKNLQMHSLVCNSYVTCICNLGYCRFHKYMNKLMNNIRLLMEKVAFTADVEIHKGHGAMASHTHTHT